MSELFCPVDGNPPGPSVHGSSLQHLIKPAKKGRSVLKPQVEWKQSYYFINWCKSSFLTLLHHELFCPVHRSPATCPVPSFRLPHLALMQQEKSRSIPEATGWARQAYFCINWCQINILSLWPNQMFCPGNGKPPCGSEHSSSLLCLAFMLQE